MPVQLIKVPDLGIGRLIEMNRDGSATAQFMTTPSVPPRILNVAHFETISLESGERVWIEPEKSTDTWVSGRISAKLHSTNFSYEVDVPNQRTIRVDEKRVWTQWDKPIEDPMAMLINHVGESPHLFANRLRALNAITTQRSRIGGLAGVWSSAIELHQHQLEAARRILADPVKRYLLADEVGLGKTVEAGLVLRQILFQDPNAKVLVLAPDHLVTQWTIEISSKFYPSDYGASRVVVLPHSNLAKVDGEYTLCIIDEIHRLVRHPSQATQQQVETYERVQSIASKSPGLLLLTATPVRAGDIDYLAILHLLSPDTHPLNDVELFRQKLSMRNKIAELMIGFTRDIDPVFIPLVVGDIREMIPGEPDLHQLLDEIENLTKLGNEIGDHIDEVRSYIANRYRLHHRMIRNRRVGRILDQFPVRGRITEATYPFSTNSSESTEALQEVRELLNQGATSTTTRVETFAACAYFVSTGVWASPRDRTAASSNLSPDCIQRLEDATKSDQVFEARVSAVVQLIKDMRTPRGGSDTRKKVLFATSSEFADEIYNQLSDNWGTKSVFRLTEDSRDVVVSDFRSSHGQTFLVCDQSVEEGVNLQFAEVVILADIPFSTRKLEQRIGRFDRFSSEFNPVRLIPLLSDSIVERTWWTHVELTGILKGSVAGLQYALSDHEYALFEAWTRRGFDEALAIAHQTKDLIEMELRELAKQDVLDSGEFVSRSESAFFEGLVQESKSSSRFESAVTSYAEDLGIALRSSGNGVRSIGSNTKRHLISPRKAAEFHPEQWSNPGSFYREVAVDTANCRVLGLGNPLIDAIADALFTFDRGRISARYLMSSHLPSGQSLPIFDLHFLIEANVKELANAAAFHIDELNSLQAVVDQVFPPIYRTQIVDAQTKKPPESMVAVVETAYSKSSTDINLCGSGHDLFRYLTSSYDWGRLCREIEVFARESVSDSTLRAEIESRRAGLQTELSEKRKILESRITMGLDLPEVLVNHDATASLLLAAVDQPTISLDCVKVTFLEGVDK